LKPGEVLEPSAMLDPRATTYVSCRLDLADAPTREFVEHMQAAFRRSTQHLRNYEDSPLLGFLVSWNENRQRRDLARLFPITAVWVVWPDEHDAKSAGAILLSARGLGHQVIFMDWMLGWVADRSSWRPHRIAGERVYELPMESGKPVYAFQAPGGVIVCLDLAAVAPAVGRLHQQRASAPAPRPPTELERRLAGVPADLPLRGAVLNRHGEVAQLLGWLAPRADRRDWEASWEPIEVATVAGRFTSGGGIALTAELAVDPTTTRARRELLVADLQRYFGESWNAGKATARLSSEGVTLDLLLDELPQGFDERQGAGRAPVALQ
jgi:hypothetical protein